MNFTEIDEIELGGTFVCFPLRVFPHFRSQNENRRFLISRKFRSALDIKDFSGRKFKKN